MIDRLSVVGPFHGPSGYDRHTREFVRQFVALGVDVHLTQLDGWSSPVPEEMRERWLDERFPQGVRVERCLTSFQDAGGIG